jgi:hypothetical protein
LAWETLREQSQLAERTREVNLELGQVRELGAFPQEPYLDNLVLLSPDIDIAAQQITGFLSDPDLVTVWAAGALPRVLKGRLTIDASPEDRRLRPRSECLRPGLEEGQRG